MNAELYAGNANSDPQPMKEADYSSCFEACRICGVGSPKRLFASPGDGKHRWAEADADAGGTAAGVLEHCVFIDVGQTLLERKEGSWVLHH